MAFLAALLAFPDISNDPPGFYIDESSICDNAYTIAKGSRDEFGISSPFYSEPSETTKARP